MRNYQVDNYKVFLTFLVVLGHVLVFMRNPSLVYPINAIYSFHMPAFIFVNGMLFKVLNYKKISKLLITFIVMQFFYLFYMDAIGYSSSVSFERLLNPVFHIWYLFAFIIWMIIMAGIDWVRQYLKRYMFWLLIILVLLLSFGIRFLNTSIPDQFLTYTRIFVFLPFFLFGFYSKNLINKISKNATYQMKVSSLIGVVTLVASVIILTQRGVLKGTSLFFGFQHIQTLPYEPLDFLLLEVYQFLVGILMLIFVYILTPNFKYKWTGLSTNITFIYLWHPAIIVFLIYINWANYSLWINLIVAILISTLVMLMLHFIENNIKIHMNKKDT